MEVADSTGHGVECQAAAADFAPVNMVASLHFVFDLRKKFQSF